MKKLLILNGAFLSFVLIARFFFLSRNYIYFVARTKNSFLNYLYDFVCARDSAAALLLLSISDCGATTHFWHAKFSVFSFAHFSLEM